MIDLALLNFDWSSVQLSGEQFQSFFNPKKLIYLLKLQQNKLYQTRIKVFLNFWENVFMFLNCLIVYFLK